MVNTKKAFSFVELLIVISILALLAVIGVSMFSSGEQKANNSKLVAGAKTLENAMQNYLEERHTLPAPGGNNNYFKIDSSYAHSGSSDAFGVYGSVTEDTLPKKYIDNIPLDPVSNHYFSYGKTLNNKYFEIAGVVREGNIARTKLTGTYPGENGPISLIREYNGPYFLTDKSQTHLPYNPFEHILTAKLFSYGDDVEVDGVSVSSGSTKEIRSGQHIYVKKLQKATVYFADGSSSVIGDDNSKTELTLSDLGYKGERDNLFTRVKLYLNIGSIYTRATALNQDSKKSDFEVYTADTTAAVRGTEFLVSYKNNTTTVAVVKGTVEVQLQNNNENNLNPITGTATEVHEGEAVKSKDSDACEITDDNGTKIKTASIGILQDFKTIIQTNASTGTKIEKIFSMFRGGSKKVNQTDCSKTLQKFTPFNILKEETTEIRKKIKSKIPKINIPKGKQIYNVKLGTKNKVEFNINRQYLNLQIQREDLINNKEGSHTFFSYGDNKLKYKKHIGLMFIRKDSIINIGTGFVDNSDKYNIFINKNKLTIKSGNKTLYSTGISFTGSSNEINLGCEIKNDDCNTDSSNSNNYINVIIGNN